VRNSGYKTFILMCVCGKVISHTHFYPSILIHLPFYLLPSFYFSLSILVTATDKDRHHIQKENIQSQSVRANRCLLPLLSIFCALRFASSASSFFQDFRRGLPDSPSLCLHHISSAAMRPGKQDNEIKNYLGCRRLFRRF
jgi:hypothetical protein